MMNLKNLAYLSLITVVAGACDVKQDLGDTATTGESSGETTGETSGGTTGGADTGVLDTGPWDDTGVVTEGTSTGSAETGVLDTGPWWETGEETGETPTCDAREVSVRWDSSGLSPEALGFGGTFVGIGACQPEVQSEGGSAVTLSLACTLSGTRDGTDFADEEIAIALDFTIEGASADILPSFSDSLSAQIVVSSAGLAQGAARYIVLEQPMLPTDGDAPVLIAVDAPSLEPSSATYAEWYEQDWYVGPSFATADATCETGDAPACGYDVALEAGWLDRSPVAVHGGGAETFGAPTEGGTYDLFVETAWEAPQSPDCGVDFPTAEFSFVALGATAS
ncbi:MAG: hypothetical protein ACRBN8_31065 [Nannocystales bacterium]